MSGNGWVVDAPCAGNDLFTMEEIATHVVPPLLLTLFKTCQSCPFRARCIEVVAPRNSRFDGVCGGRLWRDGQVVVTSPGADPAELREPRLRPITHGTEAGARAHRRRGERGCSLCLEADRLAQQDRRARKRATGS